MHKFTKLFIFTAISFLFVSCAEKATDLFPKAAERYIGNGISIMDADELRRITNKIKNGTPIYNIKGYKDKRLRLVYMLEYGCFSSAGYKNPYSLHVFVPISDRNYEIDIPIEHPFSSFSLGSSFYGCTQKLIGVNMRISRIVDRYLGLSIWILRDRQLNDYNNYMYNIDSKRVFDRFPSGTYEYYKKYNMTLPERKPATNKKYFRVAPQTSILCGTAYMDFDKYTEEQKNLSVEFYCVPQTDSGNNSQFGVDEMVSSNLTVNIAVGDNSSFRLVNGGGVLPAEFKENKIIDREKVDKISPW